MSVMVETPLGSLVIDLFTEECPQATRNFLRLCKAHYYDNVLFFKVEKDFIAQAGDRTGTGKGGTSFDGLLHGKESRFFGDEIVKGIRHKRKGSVSMANFGPLTGTNSSQFFLTLRDGLDFLDDNYTMFGEVVEGEEALDKMNALFVDERHRPLQDVRIRATHVLYDPFPEPERMPDAPDTDASGKRPAEETVLARPSIDEPVGDEGRTEEELAEEGKAKEARNRAVVLEMVGDLPDADVKPPENVLFVCKLNPVTQDEDLELIFSRFGEIRSCEVIRDQQTGDSLQYAFIEFESQPQCEEAYLKMNNVLIDDRRIKVDFSQSVAKLWNKYNSKWKGGAPTREDGEEAGQRAQGEPIRGGAGRDRWRLKDKHQVSTANFVPSVDDGGAAPRPAPAAAAERRPSGGRREGRSRDREREPSKRSRGHGSSRESRREREGRGRDDHEERGSKRRRRHRDRTRSRSRDRDRGRDRSRSRSGGRSRRHRR